jgi:hypothetical protein
MDRLEESLKSALARKEPPEGFAQRVAAKAARPAPASGAWVPQRWIAAAAVVVMAVGGGVAYRQHQGEMAKEQVMQAMKITAVKLHRIQAHVHEVRQ